MRLSFLEKIPGISFWKPVILWALWFSVWRFLFALIYYGELSGSAGHKLMSWPAGLRLDVVTACYMSMVWLVFYLVYQWWNKPFLLRVVVVFHWALVILTTAVLIGNLGLYATWQTPLNNRMMLYLKDPAEISHFIPVWQVIALPLAIGLISWLAVRFSKNFFLRVTPEKSNRNKIIATLWVPSVFLLFIRGGWQQMPVNESAACYSVHSPNNHAAMNPVFYFGHSVSEMFFLNEKYAFYSEEIAAGSSAPYFEPQLTEGVDTMLTQSRPNIVIIFLESWTADLLNNTYNGNKVTPFTDSLLSQSLWCTQAYGPGYRTDQGLVAVLSGYPTQPDNSIIAFPAKTESLPAISQELKKINYQTSFFYGGELEFANMKNYLVQKGFEHFCDKHDFPSSQQNSKWGAHDENVLMKQAEFLHTSKQPFLSCVLTLSTHEPFEVPAKSPFTGNTNPEKFMHSAYYTDKSLRNYFTRVQNEKWFKNTLFILVADHGHYLPKNRDMNMPESRKITLLFTGNVLHKNLMGQKVEWPVSQVDIPRTLCNWLKIDGKMFGYSRNMFAPGPRFAYYANENVLGWVENDRFYRYYFNIGRNEGDSSLSKQAKSYLQMVYSDFVKR